MSISSTTRGIVNSDVSVIPAANEPLPLPGWFMKFPGITSVVERLGVTEFRRRLFHMTPALLPVGLPWIPHADVWGTPLMLVVAGCTGAAIVFARIFRPFVVRDGERTWMNAVLGYVTPILAAILLFPGRGELGLMTLQILAMGDGAATFGGLLLKGPHLPWNRRKTFSGFFCFIVAGTSAATYSYWGEARPALPLSEVFFICSIAAVCAALVESMPLRSNDNLRVGFTALIAGAVLSSFFQ